MLLKYTDKKNSNNKNIFKELIEEINILQKKGIIINVNKKEINVKFQLVLICGDNLGLNGMLGFVESFSTSHCCRICKADSTQIKSLTVECDQLLRTKEQYSIDIVTPNPKESGIKEECVFNSIENYHFLENVSVDAMHDFLEGLCLYVLESLLFTFVFVKKYLTVENVNMKIESLQYNGESLVNKPPIISATRLKNKLGLKMSAAETNTFLHFFGILIGDYVPRDDVHWNLFKLLRRISDVIMSPRVLESDVYLLRNLINQHHTLYIQFYDKLPFKFHNLIHYPRLIIQNGPFINYWTMRFEAYHRNIKSNSVSVSGSKNLLTTIAKKQVLRMCQLFHSFKIENNISFGMRDKYYRISRRLLDKLDVSKEVEYYDRIYIQGYTYQTGVFVVVDIVKIEKEFGKLLKIIKIGDEIYFELEIYHEISFDDHYHAFVVDWNGSDNKIIKFSDIPKVAPCFSVDSNNIRYIITKYIL